MMREIVENQEMLKLLIALMLSLACEGIIVIIMMVVIRHTTYQMFRDYNHSLRAITKWIDLHEKLEVHPKSDTEGKATP